MSLIIANFRDVGHAVNLLAGRQLLREAILFRGGRYDDISSPQQIGSPRTIINLRKGRDAVLPDIRNVHLPAPDTVELYSVDRTWNRKWILAVLSELGSLETQEPIFYHCASGTDRTGIITAAVLVALRVPKEVILQEYRLSRGILRVDQFRHVLEIMGSEAYFRGVDTDYLVNRFATGG